MEALKTDGLPRLWLRPFWTSWAKLKEINFQIEKYEYIHLFCADEWLKETFVNQTHTHRLITIQIEHYISFFKIDYPVNKT